MDQVDPNTRTRARGPHLEVISADQAGRVYPLDAAVTIGRGVTNTVVIADTRASRAHATIRQVPGETRWQLTDHGSTNGTTINGDRVASADLADGDVIRIGAFALRVALAAHSAPTSTAAPVVVPTPVAPGDNAVPTTVDLRAQAVVTVGRDVANTLALDHPQISRYHARLTVRADGTLDVTDLQSTNGTFVDGQQVHGTVAAAEGALLGFGPFRWRVQHGALVRVNEASGTVRIDALHVTKTVGEGTVLLDDVTFSVLPREFVCIVGGSGAGKSTLLDALSGVRPANGGEIRYNGAPLAGEMEAYCSVIGYVPQDDIVPTELPVGRALYYAAKLRLPPDTAEHEVHARVDEVLDDLELTARRDVPITNLSGGQRKRVSIGAELLAKPTLFFLDEPTSGLDPGLEGRMMHLLRKLADQGRTVILITHATQNVDLCDNIAFLAPGGHLAYYGPPHEALAYFGVTKFADIYTTIEAAATMAAWTPHFQGSPQYQHHVSARLVAASIDPSRDGYVGVAATRAGAPGGTGWAGSAGGGAGHTAAVGAPGAPSTAIGSRPPVGRRDSPLRQFGILARRYGETIVRDRANLVALLLVQAPLIALLIALAFPGHLYHTEQFVGDWAKARILAFLLAMVAVWFGTANAAREIVKEAAMYARERRITLQIAPYVASKYAILLLVSLVQDVVLLLPFLLTGGGGFAGLRLPLLYLALVVGSCAGIAIGLIISALAPNPDRASILVPLILIPQVIFGGPLIGGVGGLVGLIANLTVTKWTWRTLGSILRIDAVPPQPVELRGFSPVQIAQIGQQNLNANLVSRGGQLFYTPPVGADFGLGGITSLGILAMFTTVSIAFVAFVLRRKDHRS